MSWIPFHSSLREGDKRGIPRAVRFVFLELSLLTRPTAGRLPLPRGFKSDIDAIHDMLGGDRKDIRDALSILTVALDPTDPNDEPMLLISGPKERRVLEIPSHPRWVRPDTSTKRVQRLRQRRIEENHPDGPPCNANGRVTETAHDGHCNALEEREERRGKREEEKKERAAVAADGSGEPSLPRTSPSAQGTMPFKLEPKSAPEPSPEAQVFDHWVEAWKRIVGGARMPQLDDKRRKKIHARLVEGFSVADLKRAVDGMWATEWNVQSKNYDVGLVCRDAAQVERFLDLAASVDSNDDLPPPHVARKDPPPPPRTPEEQAAIDECLAATEANLSGLFAR